MATDQITPRVLVTDPNTTDGGYKVTQGWREGSVSSTTFYERMAAAGRVMVANFGTVVTQLTFLTQAANRPDMWIRVPSGTTIIPWDFHLALGAMTGTVTTVDMRIAYNDIGNGTSSAASVGPQNLRTDNPSSGAGTAGNCTARQLATADTTAETTPITIYKHVWIRADDAGSDGKNLHLTRATAGGFAPSFLIGPATWETFVWATTNQATGYGVKTWIETPSIWWT